MRADSEMSSWLKVHVGAKEWIFHLHRWLNPLLLLLLLLSASIVSGPLQPLEGGAEGGELS